MNLIYLLGQTWLQQLARLQHGDCVPRIPIIPKELLAIVWEVDHVCRVCNSIRGSVQIDALLDEAQNPESPLRFLLFNSGYLSDRELMISIRFRVACLLGRTAASWDDHG